ncbi:MAG: response regulator [Spirochaetes bacterium]|nr:response regulator [Spirochaetota bacterium]
MLIIRMSNNIKPDSEVYLFFHDIVLLDIVMQGIRGAEVYYRLREINPEVKVLIISGYAQIENIPDRVTGFLKKPFHSVDLLI